MPDIGAIAAGITSLQTAGEIAKSLFGMRDAAMIQGKVIELQSVILAAQQSALTAQAEQSALLEQIRSLKQKVTSLEAWEAEKQRYQLTDVGLGRFAYSLKPAMQAGEPMHSICAGCYQHGRKSILQPDATLGWDTLRCPQCKEQIEVRERAIVI